MNNKSKLIFRAASIASINTQRQRISPWNISIREFYVILMRLHEMLKMKQFMEAMVLFVPLYRRGLRASAGGQV